MRCKEWHVAQTIKAQVEQTWEDHGLHHYLHPRMWGILTDKWYQRALEFKRSIIPKMPQNCSLFMKVEAFNRKVSTDRKIVEKYFGHFFGLWKMFEQKWSWYENLYDEFFRLGVSLTNLDIKWQPLREGDQEKFSRLRNRLQCFLWRSRKKNGDERSQHIGSIVCSGWELISVRGSYPTQTTLCICICRQNKGRCE